MRPAEGLTLARASVNAASGRLVVGMAGSAWVGSPPAGVAMGIRQNRAADQGRCGGRRAQNTGQNIVASLTPPPLGLVVGGSSDAVGFALAALFPLAAILVTPIRTETARRLPPGRVPA